MLEASYLHEKEVEELVQSDIVLFKAEAFLTRLKFIELLIYPKRQDIDCDIKKKLLALITINLYDLLYLGIAVGNLQIAYPNLRVQSLRLS